jgi:hypothetical protein
MSLILQWLHPLQHLHNHLQWDATVAAVAVVVGGRAEGNSLAITGADAAVVYW